MRLVRKLAPMVGLDELLNTSCTNRSAMEVLPTAESPSSTLKKPTRQCLTAPNPHRGGKKSTRRPRFRRSLGVASYHFGINVDAARSIHGRFVRPLANVLRSAPPSPAFRLALALARHPRCQNHRQCQPPCAISTFCQSGKHPKQSPFIAVTENGERRPRHSIASQKRSDDHFSTTELRRETQADTRLQPPETERRLVRRATGNN